jgi:hypothetical protein
MAQLLRMPIGDCLFSRELGRYGGLHPAAREISSVETGTDTSPSFRGYVTVSAQTYFFCDLLLNRVNTSNRN